jgi:hypothetical protein
MQLLPMSMTGGVVSYSDLLSHISQPDKKRVASKNDITCRPRSS